MYNSTPSSPHWGDFLARVSRQLFSTKSYLPSALNTLFSFLGYKMLRQGKQRHIISGIWVSSVTPFRPPIFIIVSSLEEHRDIWVWTWPYKNFIKENLVPSTTREALNLWASCKQCLHGFRLPRAFTQDSSVVLDDASIVMPSEILRGKEDMTQLWIEEMIAATESKFYWRQILNK